MATLTVKHDIRGTIGGEELVLTHSSNPPTIPDLTRKYDVVLTIPASTTIVLWDPTLTGVPSSVADFDFAYFLASEVDATDIGGVDVDIEFTCNEDNADERQFMVVAKVGIPLVLGDDISTFNYAVGAAGDAFAGTLDVIDRIRARNRSATTSAKLRMVLAT